MKLTQIVLGANQSYLITTRITHTRFIKLVRPSSYEIKLNGLPTVKLPSEELFGDRVAEGVMVAQSVESLGSRTSGYQEDGYNEMQSLATQKDLSRKMGMEVDSTYYLSPKQKKVGERNSEDAGIRRGGEN